MYENLYIAFFFHVKIKINLKTQSSDNYSTIVKFAIKCCHIKEIMHYLKIFDDLMYNVHPFVFN